MHNERLEKVFRVACLPVYGKGSTNRFAAAAVAAAALPLQVTFLCAEIKYKFFFNIVITNI